MDPQLNGLPTDIYLELFEKSTELTSYMDQYRMSLQNLGEIKNDFFINHIKTSYRTPWILTKVGKKIPLEKFFSFKKLEISTVSILSDPIIIHFFKSVIDNRITLIYRLMDDPRNSSDRILTTVFQIPYTPFDFFATFVVPPVFGFFTGKSNVSDFIESIGLAFDVSAVKPVQFMNHFGSSFLCSVLKRFFYTSHFRKYIGEQFTSFFEFCMGFKRSFESQKTIRFSRLFSMFLSELLTSASGWPSFLRSLFNRMSKKFPNRSQIIMIIIIYCIFIPIVSNPKLYAVVPLSSVFPVEFPINTDSLLTYCLGICGLPGAPKLSEDEKHRDSDPFDVSLISKLTEVLTKNCDLTGCGPDIERSAMTLYSLVALAMFETDQPAKLAVNSLIADNDINTVIGFPIDTKKKTYQVPESLVLLLDLFENTGINSNPPLFPRIVALKTTLNLRYFNSERIMMNINNSISECYESISSCQKDINELKLYNDLLNRSITASESLVSTIVCSDLMEEYWTNNEIEKKKSSFLLESQSFAHFIVSNLETFFEQNPWTQQFTVQIARSFYSKVMEKFPLQSYCNNVLESKMIDDRFLQKKSMLLESIEKGGVDKNTSMIIHSDKVLHPAQTSILRAYLFANPIESAKQVSLGLATVEDLYVFLYGEPPEANQLLPLIAHLFVQTPIPAPLSFGKWMKHFLHEISSMKPEWFSDGEIARLEHFFKFNQWVESLITEK